MLTGLKKFEKIAGAPLACGRLIHGGTTSTDQMLTKQALPSAPQMGERDACHVVAGLV